ncbi:hypothetical protein EDC04DRAFT_1353144 [Pisolithus marmoratus]|nr:hypothetical protein EDC04DRAFT_1353144 [Pisolithus marmoratus]
MSQGGGRDPSPQGFLSSSLLCGNRTNHMAGIGTFGAWTQSLIGRREFLSEVNQIKKWREMLIKTNDEHERRTLVEDTVGKILLACWSGVKSEIVQALKKVVDQYVNGDDVELDARKNRAGQLYHIARVVRKATDYIPGDYLNPLQRMMDDAAHGVSKHQLLLSERIELAALSHEAEHTH